MKEKMILKFEQEQIQHAPLIELNKRTISDLVFYFFHVDSVCTELDMLITQTDFFSFFKSGTAYTNKLSYILKNRSSNACEKNML